MFIHKYTNRGSGNIIDYNLYYTTGPAQWTWNGVAYTHYNLWKAACGGDASSTYGTDPLFVNTSGLDFHLQSSSVAKNSGQVISDGVNGTVDFDGNTRIVNKQISKGAYQ